MERILAAKRAGDAAVVARLEGEIDAHVYRLYGLTPAEIALVEGTVEARGEWGVVLRQGCDSNCARRGEAQAVRLGVPPSGGPSPHLTA